MYVRDGFWQAVEAMHEGAYDFVAKPYAVERLVASIRRALEKRRLVLDNRRLRAAADSAQADWPLIGQTPVMERLRATLRQLADADVADLRQAIAAAGMRGSASLVTWPAKARELVGAAG